MVSDKGASQIPRIHGAKIIWNAIWIAIWIAIQQMYLFAQDIHCSKQQSATHNSLLHCNPPNIWIKIIQIAIKIECLHGTTFLYPDRNHDRDPDNLLRVNGVNDCMYWYMIND